MPRLLTAALVLVGACQGGKAGPGLEPPDDGVPGVGPGFGSSAGAAGVVPTAGTAGSPVAGSSGVGGAGGAGVAGSAGTPQAGSAGAPTAGGVPNGMGEGLDDGGVPLDGGEGGTDDPFFVGRWVVDQPTHALYEATLYELAAGGALYERGVSNLGGDMRVTGSVATETGPHCSFAGHWRSPAPRRLVVGLACDDYMDREATLELLDGDTATGVGATVVSVDGESGWDHRDFPWSWRRCPDSGACPPF